ncbi:hypothetical protein BT96DRAFT_924225 [Gymnopus androsaceus JB14]|uniref:Uncharacterized protein n=1 Tax=Gymnopus androsaceus JB14 TaxID=1447944 RepID=A0A6A4H4Z3_9AGAR|nr:hypothetical protein BT96DRAFT_924225 [Gymnopus androsaceus JB14]
MGSTTEVYNAEMVGLAHGDLFADNLSAITTIYDQKPLHTHSDSNDESSPFSKLTPSIQSRSLGVPDRKGGNERADGLAKEAGELWAPTFHTYTHARRISKERALAKWHAQWKQMPARGGFAVSNVALV